MRILHIVRRLGDERAVGMAREQAKEHEVKLLLLHDAVLQPPTFDGRIYACLADVEARLRRKGYETLDYPEVVRLICDSDRVVTW